VKGSIQHPKVGFDPAAVKTLATQALKAQTTGQVQNIVNIVKESPQTIENAVKGLLGK
jgi:hypothetical protein